MPLASFHIEDVIGTHLAHREDKRTFLTACGQSFWGIGSATGYGHPERVSCEACRAILLEEQS